MNEESLIERRSSWGFAYQIKIPSCNVKHQEDTKKRIKTAASSTVSNISTLEAKLDESMLESKKKLGSKDRAARSADTHAIFQSFFDKHGVEKSSEKESAPIPTASTPDAAAIPGHSGPVEEFLTVSRSDPTRFSDSDRRSQVFFAEESPLVAEKEFQRKLEAVRQRAFLPPLGPSSSLDLSDPSPYIYRRHLLSPELLELSHHPPSFENFVRLFNHFFTLETSNFKSQSFCRSSWCAWLFERVTDFLRDDFEARIVEAERCDQLVQAKPNMKNIFNQERLEVVLKLQTVFEKALSSLERFEAIFGRDTAHLSTEKECANIKFKIFKALNHTRKMSRYLSHRPELTTAIEEARKKTLKPQLHSFNEASARFEENTKAFSDLLGQIDRCGQANKENATLAYARASGSLKDVIECSAIEACRSFLL